MLAVQTFFTLAFMASLGTQVLLAALVVRWPLGVVLQNEWILTFMSCLGNAAAGKFYLLIVSKNAFINYLTEIAFCGYFFSFHDTSKCVNIWGEFRQT